jgi:ribonucleoside-diphosphate reductase alpha chain
VQTFDAAIGGHRVHLSVGEYPGSMPRRPCLLKIEVHKEGGGYRSIMAALARSVTHGLQRGVPLGVYVDDWIGCRFEPCGATDDPDLPTATSILDWMARTLAAAYPEACALVEADALPVVAE